MTGEDSTVQVPMSLPTRDEVAAEVKRVTHAWSGPSMDEFISDPPTRKQYAIADAVLALLSQPTPTAESTQTCGVCGRKYPASDTRDTCPVCWPGFGEYGAGFHKADGTRQQPEPPRIEDMALGTTFVRNTDRWDVARRWTVREDGKGVRYLVDYDGRRWPPSMFPPFVIRDVTPPTGGVGG